MASKKSRLEAAAAEATKIYFTGADDGTPEGGSEAAQGGAETGETTKTTRSKAKEPEAVRGASEASNLEPIIFSVRANPAAVADWKSYAKAKRLSMTSVVAAAMAEYMKRHTLTAEELETYKREMRKFELLKSL